MPEIAGQKAFTSGADGSAPTRASYQTALTTFDSITNPMLLINADASYAFASGGETGARAAKVLLDTDVTAYADARGDVFALIDPPAGSTTAEALTYAIDGCGAVDGGNAAMYFPWVVVPDALKSAPGATRVVGPAAIAAGKYLETDASRGVFKTPAGFGTKIGSAVALERSLRNAELYSLTAASKPVNAIRNVPGAGIVIMGGRTLNNSTGERYINVRRSMIFLKKELTDRSNFAVFENNSEALWAQLRNSLGNFLREYWSQGGLRGATPAEAFYVRCDASNNSATDILSGRVNIEIGVAVEYPAEFIVISIGQITGSASA
jgi:phage tail sheath protein FI